MINILTARQFKDTISNDEWVTVDIEIDGQKTSVGRIDPKWDKTQILAYLDKIKPEIRADIAKNETEQSVIDRTDLYTARDLKEEIDGLKETIAAQATKITEIKGKIASK